MNLRPNEQQVMLRESARRFLREEYAFEKRRAYLRDGAADLWGRMAALGWPGAALPEEAGGLGGSVVELAILMEEMGRALYVGPFLSNAICAAMLRCAASGRARELLERIATHEAKVALAHLEPGARGFFDPPTVLATGGPAAFRITGRKHLAHDFAEAEAVLVSAVTSSGQALFVLDPNESGFARRDYQTIDNGSASDLDFDGAAVTLIAEGEQTKRALDEGFYWLAIALGAEAAGVAEGALRHTMDYVAGRKQFGRALADFQVVQHRIADMFVEVEQLRSSILNALSTEQADRTERRRAALGLKILAGSVATKVAGDGLHLHGGMGMTDEMPISHFYRRARVIETQYGNSDYFLAAYARLIE